ncbi:MAG: hypothetical protein ACPG5B_14070 [Chitinophagales bacterium]
MKSIKFLILTCFTISTLSSCAAWKAKKCDCPKFSEQTPLEQGFELENNINPFDNTKTAQEYIAKECKPES